MKKLILFILCACLLLPLVSCAEEPESPADDGTTHTHTAAMGYSCDEAHHWRACTVEGCNIKMEWAEHTFADKEITTLPSAEAPGVMTYYCGCGQTKTEPVEYEEANDTIFGGDVFDERFNNVTVRVIATERVGNDELATDAVLCFDNGLMSIAGTVRGEQFSGNVIDAALIANYRQVLFFCNTMTADGWELDKTTRIYYTDLSASVRDGSETDWTFTNVGIKIKDDRITYVVCDYENTQDGGRGGHMTLTIYDYGNTYLQ